MEPSKDTINVRLARLNAQLWGRGTLTSLVDSSGKRIITRELLLDVLTTLYDECNKGNLKNDDVYIANFVDKYRSVICELKQLRVNISDFEVKDLIGRGYFGEVHVVREKHTGDVYAMKTLRKDLTLKHINLAYFEEERDIMALSKSEWLIKLKYAFHDASQLYLIMEYCPGGDLAGLMDRIEKPLSEKDAIFYVTEIIQALYDIHSLGFVHRDIKPDNILLDRCGHLKLADFGSAARIASLGKTKFTMPIGTTEYISPEILLGLEKPECIVQHGTPCDYWSLGIVAYELITFTTPFRSNDKKVIQTYKNIIDHASNTEATQIKYPDTNKIISNEYKDLVKNLLHPAPDKRPDYSNLMKFKVFRNILWETIRQQAPPFVPIINSQDDTSNFMEIEKQDPILSADSFRSKSTFSGKNLPFIGFTHIQDVSNIIDDVAEKDVLRKDSGCNSSGESVSSNGFFNNSMNGTAICLSNIKEMETLLESRKREIELLHKKLASFVSKQTSSHDSTKKIDNLEKERLKLEKELLEMSCQNQKLQHQLEMEHKGREVLESKSLQLIRSAKERWKEKTEEQVSSLKKIVNEHESKKAETDDAIRELENQLASKSTSLENALEELNTFKKLQLTHKESMAKARRLSRQSIVGIEQITQENNTQIQNLTQSLNKEIQLKSKLELELKSVKESLNIVEKRESNLTTAFRNEKDYYTNELMILSNKYDAKCQELSLQLFKNKEMDDQLNLIKLNDKEKHDTKIVEYSKKISLLETHIKELKANGDIMKSSIIEKEKLYNNLLQEKSSIESALNDALICEEKHKKRVTSLEEMLSKLQEEVAILENTNHQMSLRASCVFAESTTIEQSANLNSLQEEIKKMQQQLNSVLEENSTFKKEARKAELDLWKKEKELSNCDLDRRIAVREQKKSEEKLKTTQEEHKNYQTLQEIKEKELQDELNSKKEEISKMQKDITLLNSSIKRLQTNINEMEKSTNSEYNSKMLVLQKHEIEIQSLKEKLLKMEADVKVSEQQKLKAENNLEILNKEFKTILAAKCSEKEEKIRLEVMLKERNKDYENLNQNYKMLKDTCTLLEEQLIDFENVTETLDSNNNQLKKDIADLQSKIKTVNSDSSTLQKELDIQKFRIISTETKNKELLLKLEEESKKNSELEQQLKDLLIYETSLSSEVESKGHEMAQLKAELKHLTSKVSLQNSENNALKEECTRLITDVSTLRENNMRIQLELKESMENNDTLRNIMKENEEEMNIRQLEWQERELKAEATIAQQIKLIDYLQVKMEENSKKKKTFGDILFGKSSTKENFVPPMTPQTPLNTNSSLNVDYSKEVLKERQKNRDLREELSILRSKLKAFEVKSNNSNNESIITSSSDQLLISDSMKIQRGALLIPVKMKFYPNIIKWTAEKDEKIFGQIELIKGSSKITSELTTKDIDLVLSESELKCGFKIETLSRTTCWPSQSLLIVCTSFQQKETWLTKLKCVDALSLKEVPIMNTTKHNINSLLKFSRKVMEPSCIIEIEKNIFFIGSTNGLFCYTSEDPKRMPIKIIGIKSISRARISSDIDQIIMLFSCGQLVHYSLRQLTAILKSAALSSIQPSTLPTFKQISFADTGSTNSHCNMFEISKCNTSQKTFLCASTTDNLIVYHYDLIKMSFVPIKTLKTETITCMKFTEHTVIVASHKFYEIDLKNFNVEEFLDPCDNTLSHAVYAHKKQIFPIAIIQTKSIEVNKCYEYLLCYSAFGIFVDEFGQRTRPDDIKWTHLPMNVTFQKPYIFISYLTGVEIVHLTDDSFQKRLELENNGDNISISSKALFNLPDRLVLDFDSLQYLGKSMSTSSIYVMTLADKPNLLEIVELNGNLIFRKHFDGSIETLNTIDDIGSCKDLKCLGKTVDEEYSSDCNSSVEIKTDFAAHIREKAKVMSSLKRENNKVELINKLIIGQKQDSSSTDSSDEASDSSFNENKVKAAMQSTSSKSNDTYLPMDKGNLYPKIDFEEKSTSDIVNDMFLAKTKQVRFN